MSLGKSRFIDHSTHPDKAVLGLYYELVSRHDHLRSSLSLYKFLEEKNFSNVHARENVLRLRESLLWFLTVEFHSRFMSATEGAGGSKRGLRKLVARIGGKELPAALRKFIDTEAEVLGYIKKQRMDYFTHAKTGNWDEFPKVFSHEYERLLDRVADILGIAKDILGTQRTCNRKGDKVLIFKDQLT